MISFDIETTCGDKDRAWIVEFALVGDGLTEPFRAICNPMAEIEAEAEKVHGISNEQVKSCPPFYVHAQRVANLLMVDGLLLGHSPYLLDLPVLAREFERSRIEFDWTCLRVIDIRGLEAVVNSHSLEAIYQRMFGRSLEGSHGAQPDAQACLDVVTEMQLRYPQMQGKTLEELALLSHKRGQQPVDPHGQLYRDEAGHLCWNFGKHKGKRVIDDPSYAHWVLDQNFSRVVKQFVRRELNSAVSARAKADQASKQLTFA